MNLGVKILSLFLAAILLLPASVQLAHSLESHEHDICTDFDTHIHEKELDCSVCDYQLSGFKLPSFHRLQEVIHEHNEIDLNYYDSLLKENSCSIITLRGPPALV